VNVPARLKSVLRALTTTSQDTSVQKHPCYLLHECVCGEPLLYGLMIPHAPDFGYLRGLNREWTWASVKPELKKEVLPLFRRSRLAAREHLEFVCPTCRRASQVQIASEGGVLPLGTMRMVYVELPPDQKEILHVEEVSRRLTSDPDGRH